MDETAAPRPKPWYFGNAEADNVRGSHWFLGQFVPPELGLRHQTALELKWGIHEDGEKRHVPWAHGKGSTISVLVSGRLHVSFHLGDTVEYVTLGKPGDYLVYGPEVVHSWEAEGHTIVLTIRFPSVEVGSTARS